MENDWNLLELKIFHFWKYCCRNIQTKTISCKKQLICFINQIYENCKQFRSGFKMLGLNSEEMSWNKTWKGVKTYPAGTTDHLPLLTRATLPQNPPRVLGWTGQPWRASCLLVCRTFPLHRWVISTNSTRKIARLPSRTWRVASWILKNFNCIETFWDYLRTSFCVCSAGLEVFLFKRLNV